MSLARCACLALLLLFFLVCFFVFRVFFFQVYEQALQETELLNLGRRSLSSSQTPRRRRVGPAQDRYDHMGAQAPKTSPAVAATAAVDSVEKTQRIVDLATDDDVDDAMAAKDSGKSTAGKKRGKGKGAREDEEEEEEEKEEDEDAAEREAEGRGEGFEGDGWEEGEVERGMLHVLVELGHLEMLLHQVRV